MSKREDIANLKAFKAIGDEFVFLDTLFVVMAHSKFDGYMSTYPALVCAYRNGNGDIKQVAFSLREVEAIKANLESR